MKTIFRLVSASLFAACVFASCAGVDKMKITDDLKVSCNPEILENVNGNINATITVTYPDGYFSPKAILVVTPVIVYEGGEQLGAPFMFQGEKVKDNNEVIPSKGGATVTKNVSFKFIEPMAKCYLELRSEAYQGKKDVVIPAIKVADGCINTATSHVCLAGQYSYKADNYQEIIPQTSETRVLYDVNSSVIRNTAANKEAIKDYKDALGELQGDSRYTIKKSRIEAYASPEGGQEYNAKLSDRRAESAEKQWESMAGDLKSDGVSIKGLGQDWDGFQSAVSDSDIEDKDLILRVLSMYSDPAVREREIRNMSQVYSEINKKVFPELRRAKFITELDYKNRTAEELEEASRTRIGVLDEESLLRAAANSDDFEHKSALYLFAAEKLGSERARYNLVALALDEDKPAVAELYLSKLGTMDADALNASGVVAMRRGDYDKAVELFKKSGNADAKANLATIDLVKGNYSAAAKSLDGTGSSNEALALILAGDYDKASAVLAGKDCARCAYLRAVVAARKGDAQGVKSNLDQAVAKDPSLKEKAASDIEFAKYL